MNKKLDNYVYPIDHSPDSELGIIQTKGAFYDSYNRRWSQNFKNLHNAISNGFDFDAMILYCTNKDGNNIDRLYILPIEELLKRTSITINKNPSNRNGRCPRGAWYEKYRIVDKDIINKVNGIWRQILEEKGILQSIKQR